MHLSTFVVASLLPYAASDASVQVGGENCPMTCYGMTCMSAVALWAGVAETGCETAESWGCDCDGCNCADTLDIDTIAGVPDDYSCAPTEYAGGATCDEMAHFGFGCHYMETRRGADCSGCLCEEAILDYSKGDNSCPMSCIGVTCDVRNNFYAFSCEGMESFDWVMGCDCSGCGCDYEEHPASAYNGMDCNGNGYWGSEVLGNDSCDEDLNSFTLLMGSPDAGYAEQTWYTCLNCEEMECDMGDCGDSCERGDTCALPLCELCADEDSVHTPTQFGREQYCTEDSYTCAPSPAPTTAAPTVATEATVAADEDGSFALATTAVFAITLLF